MKLLRIFSITITFIFTMFLSSCSDDDSSERGTSRISVKLVDAPGDYESVNVEIVDVMVKYDGNVNDDNDDSNDDNDFQGQDYDDDDFDDEDGEWVSLELINSGVVNLLDLTGGVELPLVDDDEIPSGFITDIRLVLGENNTIVMDGQELPLVTPSGQQSGLKVKVDADLLANFGYVFILDFQVDESIVMAGNSGNINLKPVMSATIEAFTGAISGQVDVAGIATEVKATTEDGIEKTTNVNEDGIFLLVGTLPGTYTVTFTPALESNLNPVIVENVNVIIGETTDMGSIDLDPND